MNASCYLNPNKGIWAGQPALSRGLYTNVTECSCFCVCADKLFKVPGMSVTVPSSTLTPPSSFIPHFVSVALSRRVPQVQSRKNAKRPCGVMFASFLSAERYAVCKQVGDVIVGKTKQNHSREQPLMATHYSSLPFTPLLF